MTEKPILFSTPMVRAILDGKKSQTRRVAKFAREPDPHPQKPHLTVVTVNNRGDQYWLNSQPNHPHHITRACPYGQPGDRLWVRETCRAEELPSGLDGVRYLADDCFIPIENTEAASDAWLSLAAYGQRLSGHHKCRKVPAIHMPRWASRITLEITGIRMERLQDISESDALAEGWTRRDDLTSDDEVHREAAREWFMDIWESINGPGSWCANPWVWVVEFRRIEL